MIKTCNIARVADNEVLVDLEYESAKLNPYQGGSSLTILTKGNGRVDSVTINEYDEDGNLVSSGVYYS